jgi:hypothetical protein
MALNEMERCKLICTDLEGNDRGPFEYIDLVIARGE